MSELRALRLWLIMLSAVACRDDGMDMTGTGPSTSDASLESAASECISNTECTNSQVAKDIGRCGARDVWCQAGTCRAVCRDVCETVSFEANSCGDDGLICNQNEPMSQVRIFYCTGIPIPCQSAADCPIYRPRTDAGAAAWDCMEGVCRYPGFRYLIE